MPDGSLFGDSAEVTAVGQSARDRAPQVLAKHVRGCPRDLARLVRAPETRDEHHDQILYPLREMRDEALPVREPERVFPHQSADFQAALG